MSELENLLIENQQLRESLQQVRESAGIPCYHPGDYVRLSDETLAKAWFPRGQSPLALMVLRVNVSYPMSMKPEVEYLVQAISHEPGHREWVNQECLQWWTEDDRKATLRAQDETLQYWQNNLMAIFKGALERKTP